MARFSNFTISRLLRRNVKSRPIFLDCVGADDIPSSDQFPYAVVVNTDNTLRDGEHWTAIFVPSPSAIEFFDSYGLPPMPNIKAYLDKFEEVTTSTKCFQSPFSNACGAYAVYFVHNRCIGKTWTEVMNTMTTCRDPDKLVRAYCARLL